MPDPMLLLLTLENPLAGLQSLRITLIEDCDTHHIHLNE